MRDRMPPIREPRHVTPVAALALVGALLLAACSTSTPNRPPIPPSGPAIQPAAGGAIKDFSLTPAPSSLELRPGLTTDVWAYNGRVPGPELRVKVGDLVRVSLTNHLPAGTTIHWHGLQVPNGEDGVPGVTQDAVPPGGRATYAFVVTTPGTYWYHSHQDSSNQEDRGLYGTLVVEPRDGTPPAVDRTLVYDEWPIGAPQMTPPPGDDSSMTRYGVYSVNGRTGAAIEPIRFQPGSTVRLRLVNAGFLTHYVHVHGAQYQIVATDGHELTGGPLTDHAIPVGAGERVDVQFSAPDGPVWVHAHDPSAPAAEIGVALLPEGTSLPAQMPGQNEPITGQVLDLLNYPARAVSPIWSDAIQATRSRTLTLDESMGGMSGGQAMPGMSGMQTRYLVNGKSFPDTETETLDQRDKVKLTFANKGRQEHPMHLHGHAFQILARDGQPVSAVLVKDTVLVPPGSSITVGFVADNPGWWMVHCHELHHAQGGMALLLAYSGAARLASAGGSFGNSPE